MARAETLADLADFVRQGSFSAAATPRIAMLDVPASVGMGGTATMSWQVQNAARTELHLSGAVQARREVPAVGRWSVRVDQPGPVIVQLNVWAGDESRHAQPDCAEARTLRVVAPPLVIRLSVDTLRGAPGSPVVLRWDVGGAASVELRRPLTGERLRAPARGAAEFTMDYVEEDVEIHASGHEPGVTDHAICHLRPMAQSLPDIAAELRAVHEPLPELMSCN